MVRGIAFLYSDVEYLEAGDFDVWPFVSKETLQLVLAGPRLLAG